MGCATSVYVVPRVDEELELKQVPAGKDGKGKTDKGKHDIGKTDKGKTVNVNDVASPGPHGPHSFSVPFGHINYTLSLPDVMGPLWNFPIEWWFYAGWAIGRNQDGRSQQVTMMFQSLRLDLGGVILYGIGTITPGVNPIPFTSPSAVEGFGTFPAPTSTSWEVSVNNIEGTYMTCKLESGTLGMPGATYTLHMTDNRNGVTASLKLRDTYGMVLEGAGGGFLRGDNGSFEFAMPSLSIEAGSTITMGKETTTLETGSLWLDRQTVTGIKPGKAFYCGNWIPVKMHNGPLYNLVFLWPTKKHQWIVGSELDPPVEPLKKIGLEYPSLSGWDQNSPIQGVNVLDSSEFDLNILHPKDPSKSPHWTSPVSGQTYCSAWHMRIRDKTYIVNVLVPNSEITAKPAFFEGAAIVCDENMVEVGRCFVEQMGYTQ